MRKRKREDYPENQNYPGDSGGNNYEKRGQNSNQSLFFSYLYFL